MDEEEKERNNEKRKFLEVEDKLANKIKVLCFLKGITIKDFVTETMKKEIEPYKSWLESVNKLRIKKS